MIVFSTPDQVDARATLDALDGRLDEDKRQAALKKLGVAAQFAPAPIKRGAKAEIDEVKRDLMQLDLAKKAGEVIPVADIERVIFDAIGDLRSAFDIEARAMADQLTIDLSLSPERAAMLFRRLRTLNTKAQSRFNAKMLALAGAEAPPVAQNELDAAETA